MRRKSRTTVARIVSHYIDTGDDGIVIKAGKDADGLRVNRPSENITITGCTVHRAHGAVTIGSETSGWVRNLVASNMTCSGTQMGVRLKSRRGRGGGLPLSWRPRSGVSRVFVHYPR